MKVTGGCHIETFPIPHRPGLGVILPDYRLHFACSRYSASGLVIIITRQDSTHSSEVRIYNDAYSPLTITSRFGLLVSHPHSCNPDWRYYLYSIKCHAHQGGVKRICLDFTRN